MRADASTNAPQLVILRQGVSMNVIEQRYENNDSTRPLWFKIRVTINTSLVEGWVRADTVSQLTPCPPIP